jgi:hypothetical protein
MMNTNEAKRIADKTVDAYSRGRYTDAGWLGIAKRLLEEGAAPAEAEWVLESKHTRWAADNANRAHHTTAADFAKYVVTRIGGTLPWQTLLTEARKDLARQNPPAPAGKSGADLAGACEGEQIADLIELARMVALGQAETIPGAARLKTRAKAIIAEIEARAKGGR